MVPGIATVVSAPVVPGIATVVSVPVVVVEDVMDSMLRSCSSDPNDVILNDVILNDVMLNDVMVNDV